MSYDIKDISLWESGETKIQWVKSNMDLLRGIEEEFIKTKPFKGLRVALSVHLEAKTAYLCRVLASGGAEMYITGSNPLSTQDDVAAALVHGGLNVYAWHGCTDAEYEEHISRVIAEGKERIAYKYGDTYVNIFFQKVSALSQEGFKSVCNAFIHKEKVSANKQKLKTAGDKCTQCRTCNFHTGCAQMSEDEYPVEKYVYKKCDN